MNESVSRTSRFSLGEKKRKPVFLSIRRFFPQYRRDGRSEEEKQQQQRATHAGEERSNPRIQLRWPTSLRGGERRNESPNVTVATIDGDSATSAAAAPATAATVERPSYSTMAVRSIKSRVYIVLLVITVLCGLVLLLRRFLRNARGVLRYYAKNRPRDEDRDGDDYGNYYTDGDDNEYNRSSSGYSSDSAVNFYDTRGGEESGAGEYRRPHERRVRRDAAYGVRRIPAYDRTGAAVVVGETTNDASSSSSSRICDDFRNPTICNVSEGYSACVACIESAWSSIRVCAHMDRDVVVVTENEDRSTTSFTLPANDTPDRGYCVRESLARELSTMRESASEVSRYRENCSVNNADWVLFRRVDTTSTATRTTTNDDRSRYRVSYNFACHCKYPHLLINRAGPLSACNRDVGCNGHGRLDDESRAQRIDPFVNGKCLCDDGWIAEYDANAGGPYCREATFVEWPSMFFPGKRRNNVSASGEIVYWNEDNDELERGTIDLHSDAVNAAFRDYITQNRKDGDFAQVRLPDPCDPPCRLTRIVDESGGSGGGDVWVCADGVDFDAQETSTGRIRRLGIGVRRDRDYLSGNGGRFPNACLVFESPEIAWNTVVAMQFLSQKWNEDGGRFASELGFLLEVHRGSFVRKLREELWQARSTVDGAYATLTRKLVAPATRLFRENPIIWTYTGEKLASVRIALNYRLFDNFFSRVKYDPMFGREQRTTRRLIATVSCDELSELPRYWRDMENRPSAAEEQRAREKRERESRSRADMLVHGRRDAQTVPADQSVPSEPYGMRDIHREHERSVQRHAVVSKVHGYRQRRVVICEPCRRRRRERSTRTTRQSYRLRSLNHDDTL